MTLADPFDLERFVTAQAAAFPAVLAELKAGRTRTHIRPTGPAIVIRRRDEGTELARYAHSARGCDMPLPLLPLRDIGLTFMATRLLSGTTCHPRFGVINHGRRLAIPTCGPSVRRRRRA